jgi:hypothetical protein
MLAVERATSLEEGDPEIKPLVPKVQGWCFGLAPHPPWKSTMIKNLKIQKGFRLRKTVYVQKYSCNNTHMHAFTHARPRARTHTHTHTHTHTYTHTHTLSLSFHLHFICTNINPTFAEFNWSQFPYTTKFNFSSHQRIISIHCKLSYKRAFCIALPYSLKNLKVHINVTWLQYCWKFHVLNIIFHTCGKVSEF